jgi:hypothetical protein
MVVAEGSGMTIGNRRTQLKSSRYLTTPENHPRAPPFHPVLPPVTTKSSFTAHKNYTHLPYSNPTTTPCYSAHKNPKTTTNKNNRPPA